MEIFVSGRQTGKTDRLVRWLRTQPKGVIVTMHESERRRLIEEYKLEPEQVVSCQNSMLLRGRDIDSVGVDNVELVLMALLGHTVDKGTMTGTEWV